MTRKYKLNFSTKLKNLFDALLEIASTISPVYISFIFFFIQYQLMKKNIPNYLCYAPQCLVLSISPFYCWAVSNVSKGLPIINMSYTQIRKIAIRDMDKIHVHEKRSLKFFGFIALCFLLYYIINDFPDLSSNIASLFWKYFWIAIGVYVPAISLCYGRYIYKITIAWRSK